MAFPESDPGLKAHNWFGATTRCGHMNHKIHIFGASGSGTTTLAKHVSELLGTHHFDADDYFWVAADPPFQQKTESASRIQALGSDLSASNGWVLSGCVAGWGDSLVSNIDLSVFVYLDPVTRLARLNAREADEFGERIEPGGDMHESNLRFIDWARSYDSASPPVRSLALHESWIARSHSPVLRVDSANGIAALVQEVFAAIV